MDEHDIFLPSFLVNLNFVEVVERVLSPSKSLSVLICGIRNTAQPPGMLSYKANPLQMTVCSFEETNQFDFCSQTTWEYLFGLCIKGLGKSISEQLASLLVI